MKTIKRVDSFVSCVCFKKNQQTSRKGNREPSFPRCSKRQRCKQTSAERLGRCESLLRAERAVGFICEVKSSVRQGGGAGLGARSVERDAPLHRHPQEPVREPPAAMARSVPGLRAGLRGSGHRAQRWNGPWAAASCTDRPKLGLRLGRAEQRNNDRNKGACTALITAFCTGRTCPADVSASRELLPLKGWVNSALPLNTCSV